MPVQLRPGPRAIAPADVHTAGSGAPKHKLRRLHDPCLGLVQVKHQELELGHGDGAAPASISPGARSPSGTYPARTNCREHAPPFPRCPPPAIRRGGRGPPIATARAAATMHWLCPRALPAWLRRLRLATGSRPSPPATEAVGALSSPPGKHQSRCWRPRPVAPTQRARAPLWLRALLRLRLRWRRPCGSTSALGCAARPGQLRRT